MIHFVDTRTGRVGQSTPKKSARIRDLYDDDVERKFETQVESRSAGFIHSILMFVRTGKHFEVPNRDILRYSRLFVLQQLVRTPHTKITGVRGISQRWTPEESLRRAREAGYELDM